MVLVVAGLADRQKLCSKEIRSVQAKLLDKGVTRYVRITPVDDLSTNVEVKESRALEGEDQYVFGRSDYIPSSGCGFSEPICVMQRR